MDNIKSATSLVIVTPSGEELIAHKSFDGSFTARSKKDINNFINLSRDWIEKHNDYYYFKVPVREGFSQRYLIL